MKIKKYINYYDLPENLQSLVDEVREANFAFDCNDADGDFSFNLIFQHSIEEHFEEKESGEELLKLMEENEIEFIQY